MFLRLFGEWWELRGCFALVLMRKDTHLVGIKREAKKGQEQIIYVSYFHYIDNRKSKNMNDIVLLHVDVAEEVAEPRHAKFNGTTMIS